MFRALIIAMLALFAIKAKQSSELEEKRVVRYLGDTYLDELSKLGVQCPEVVVAQMALETNYLSSRIYKKNHNLFGMKESSRNWDTGENLGHAMYPDDAHSLADYIAWQKARFGNRVFKSNEEYIYALGHLFKRQDGNWARYAEDKDYEKKLNYIINILYHE